MGCRENMFTFYQSGSTHKMRKITPMSNIEDCFHRGHIGLHSGQSLSSGREVSKNKISGTAAPAVHTRDNTLFFPLVDSSFSIASTHTLVSNEGTTAQVIVQLPTRHRWYASKMDNSTASRNKCKEEYTIQSPHGNSKSYHKCIYCGTGGGEYH